MTKYHCIGCNKEFTEGNNDIHSEYIDEYCRYLGYCDIKCWDKLPMVAKHEIAELALLKGSTHKIEHTFYIKNLKGYK